ncbi:MAG: glycine--tRNA ligase subunit beta [Sphingomonadales bacterium]|nr:glycine--tRNA ligase subunit beta [Sphingomonadales bacterium]
MAELLLELLSEEIPARMQPRAREDLQRLMAAALKEAGLEFSSMAAYSTPRRLALVVEGLPEAQPDISEERRGPRADAPDKAVEGFLRSVGLTRDQLEEREEKKGTFLYAKIEKKGLPTARVLGKIVLSTIFNFPWPKSMRWSDGRLQWVRPLRSILCLFDGEVVPLTAWNIDSGNQIQGHRFLAPEPFAVKDYKDYKAKLLKHKVVLVQMDRREAIHEEAKGLAERHRLELIDDPALLDEVTGLVEWPVALLGGFDDAFLELPPEVLTTAMRSHQKYFALRDPKTGNLAPNFITIANIKASDGGKAIAAGNERVLTARLSDAKFFWDQDLKTKLEDRLPALGEIVFHEKLGTVAERVERIEKLAIHIAKEYIPDADVEQVRRAAKLSKADLVTEMVGEFPELQGLMGSYYAAAQGEAPEVAQAICEHYAPKGPDDACPTVPVSVAVALAEKLDTLVGFFAIDERPTGSKDPFALRRAALGVIRLIVENGLRVSLGKLADEALLAFFADRLKVQQREKGVPHDLIDAVFSLGGEDDLVRLLARVVALQEFLKTEDGANLLTGYRRAANIVRIEEKNDGRKYDGAVDAKLLREPQEKTLYERLGAARGEMEAAVAVEDFADAMTALASLRAPVDSFFDEVTVNAPDAALRENRLNLLSEIRTVMRTVADFSKIEG